MTEPFDVTRVENLVVECLNAIVSAAASFSPPVVLPSRQIAGAGNIPYDCEQVLATIQLVATGAPEQRSSLSASTWPPQADGANQTLYQATIVMAIVRKTNDTPTGPLGNIAPAPTAYLANLAAVSQDMAVLMAALSQIADAQISATPRTLTAGNPQGGLIPTSVRFTVLV